MAGYVGEDKSRVSSNRRRRKLGLFVIVAALVVALDQLSKLWVRAHLAPGESLPITGRLSLTYVGNTGSAFGLLANQTFLLIIVGIASLLIILLFLRYLSQVTTLSMVSIGLIWGGAVGNLIDRLRFGYVIDFIDFRLWGSFHWPAFNIADAAITVGVFILIYSFYKSGMFRKRL
ncbi:MAG: signal peptidase II [Chloroflexi bacterium]|nr:signal peptidase II [Chloroflexota bacterium]